MNRGLPRTLLTLQARLPVRDAPDSPRAQSMRAVGRPCHAASTSAATRSRWPWTWVGDDVRCKKYGAQLGLVGPWWSGQEHRVRSGIDGILLLIVMGESH